MDDRRSPKEAERGGTGAAQAGATIVLADLCLILLTLTFPFPSLDVAKFRNLINPAKKITNPGRSAAFPRQYNTFRYSGAVGYNPPTVMRSQPVLGPCFNCGQYGHLRAHCTQTRSMSFNLNSDGGASRRQDFLAYFRKP